MIRLTVEETNLLSIYNEGGKRALIENVNAALPYMDADMRELAKRTLSKVDALLKKLLYRYIRICRACCDVGCCQCSRAFGQNQ